MENQQHDPQQQPPPQEEHEEGDCWTLDTLPIELLLRITTFLPSRDLLLTLPLVSRHFHAVLSNEATWKIRQHKLWPSANYPPVQLPCPSPPRFWSRSTLKREEQIRIWSNFSSTNNTSSSDTKDEQQQQQPTLIEIHTHIACVDAVHLFNSGKLLATGSRDRSIAIHDVDRALLLDNNSAAAENLIVARNRLAHKGWIWAFQTTTTPSSSYRLISGSWDNHVKYWDVNSGLQQPIHEFKTSAAVLALSTESHVTSCGTFDRRVIFLDDREPRPVSEYRAHTKCVLALGMDDTRVISCGEDGRLVLFDRRAHKVVKVIKMPAYPKSLSFSRHTPESNPLPLFYVGDIRGNVHLVDIREFKITRTYEHVHSRAVQGVFHTLGSVLTCSSDGTMTVREPSTNLKPIATVTLNKVELPAVHVLENRVALAGGDSIVRLWAPPTTLTQQQQQPGAAAAVAVSAD